MAPPKIRGLDWLGKTGTRLPEATESLAAIPFFLLFYANGSG
jgi:hypothetical protein